MGNFKTKMPETSSPLVESIDPTISANPDEIKTEEAKKRSLLNSTSAISPIEGHQNAKDNERLLKDKPKMNRQDLKKRPVFCCRRCHFWSQQINIFHKHVLMAHKKTKCFKCPYCSFRAKTGFAVKKHVRQVSKTDPSHKKSATCLTLVELPADRYAGYVKLAKVPTTSNHGIFPAARKTETGNRADSVKAEIPNKMDQSPTISSSIVESSTEIPIVLQCVPSADLIESVVKDSVKFELSDVDRLVEEKVKYLKEKESVKIVIEENYRNLEMMTTSLQETRKQLSEQHKKIADFNSTVAQQHNLLAETSSPILHVLKSLTDRRQKAHSQYSDSRTEKLLHEISFRSQQKEMSEIELEMIDIEELSESYKKLEKKLMQMKLESEQSKIRMNSFDRDMLTFQQEERDLDFQIKGINTVKIELEIMEAFALSLEDRISTLQSQVKDLISDQRKRIEMRSKLDVKITQLNIELNQIEDFKKLRHFSDIVTPLI